MNAGLNPGENTTAASASVIDAARGATDQRSSQSQRRRWPNRICEPTTQAPSTSATMASLNGTSAEWTPGTNIDARIAVPCPNECARKNTAAMLNIPNVATASAARPKGLPTLPKSQTYRLTRCSAQMKTPCSPPQATNVHAAPCQRPTSRNANSRLNSPRTPP